MGENRYCLCRFVIYIAIVLYFIFKDDLSPKDFTKEYKDNSIAKEYKDNSIAKLSG